MPTKNQWNGSPKLSYASLQASTSSRSHPPSPVLASSSTPFAFPPNSNYSFPPPQYQSNSLNNSINSRGLIDPTEILPLPSSTTKFHEALASRLTSNLDNNNHLTMSSSPSSTSSNETTPFTFPPDHASPSRERAFDVLQRELVEGGSSGIFGLGLDSDGSRVPSPTFNTRQPTSLSMSRNGSGGITTEEQDFSEGYESERRRDVDYRFAEESFEASGSGFGNGRSDRGGGGMGHGIGRPASMDMGGGEDEGDSNFGFLLSPPPTLDSNYSTARPQTNSPTMGGTKGKERSRTFPVPLLLKGNRPFGGGSSSPILGGTAPLVVGRKSSNSVTSGSPITSFNNFAPTPTRSLWSSHPPSAPLPPPPPINQPQPMSSPESSRPGPSFNKQHRYQQSSTSSLTYPSSQPSELRSSISYSHSPSTSSPIITTSTMYPSTSGSISSIPSLSSEAPISPQALLLYILSLRSSSQPMSLSQSQGPLRSNPNASFVTGTNTHQRIRSAGYNSDNEEGSSTSPTIVAGTTGRLDTVDLSHRRISEVTIEVIEELSDEVERLALGYNLLRELPTQFVLMKNLRYLNVRVNMLSIFPQVLCEMPSLDILDISRNKIRRLPTNPGTLLQLRIFSIAKNRIKRLPYYLTQMTQLKTLKIDHNPLEWPPKEVTMFPSIGGCLSGNLMGDNGERRASSKVEDAEEMAKWLPELLRWIRENGDRRPRRPSLPLEQTSDEERSAIFEDSSVGRNMTSTESGRLTVSPGPLPVPFLARTARSTISPSPQGRSKGPTRMDSANSEDQSPRQAQQHTRNASHSTVRELETPPRPGLKSKKSLPDLRQSHADILAERRTGSGTDDDSRPRPSASALRRLQEERFFHSNSARSASIPSQSPTSILPTSLNLSTSRASSTRPAPLNLSTSKMSGFTSRVPASATRAEFAISPGKMKEAGDRNATGVDRNSGAYFRRLSMLPPSTISKAVPINLLEFADAIRGILFSLSQIYTALRQFVVFASQDRLPAALARLMGNADGSMSLLINALDRFDSLSRRGTPETAIIRDIFVTCRDNVVTFGQLIAALTPQLETLLATADVRYTRTLLLMLYGSMGEIANSWNAISPLLQEMSTVDDNPSLATLILQPPTPSPVNNLSSSTSSRPGPPGLNRARSKTRRHAGSFSVEDVQLGSVIPPAPFGTPPPASSNYNSDPPSLALPAVPSYQPPSTPTSDSYTYSSNSGGGGSGGTIKARPAKHPGRPSLPNPIILPPQPTYRELVVNSFDQPSTPGGSTFDSTSDLPPPSYGSLNSSQNNNSTVGIRMADELFVTLVESTTRIAFEVYATLLDSFDEDGNRDKNDDGAGILMRELGTRRIKELTDVCIVGNEMNTKLKGALGRVKGPGGTLSFSPAEAKKLGDEAFLFVSTVIRFAKLVKAITLEHRFPTAIAEGVGSLTVATRELAKHLSHANTSFRPLPTARNYE